jgi:uncharacterized protein YbcI
MNNSGPTMARQIAQVASALQEQRTGHTTQSVDVVLGDETLVITLHGALSPAEKDLAKSPEGASQVQEFHRQLFANASDSLRQEVQKITGVKVREATAEVRYGVELLMHSRQTGVHNYGTTDPKRQPDKEQRRRQQQ